MFENSTIGAPDHSKLTKEQLKDKKYMDHVWRTYFKLKHDEFAVGCESGSNAACTSLAEFYYIIASNNKKAETILKPLCYNKKWPQACFWLGNVYMEGEHGVERNMSEAYKSMKIGCDNGGGQCCGFVGRMLLFGTGTEKNIDEGIEYSHDACVHHNDGDMCQMIAQYHTGQLIGLPEDKRVLRTAAKYFKLACENNISIGCHNLSVMYKKGIGVAVNKVSEITNQIIIYILVIGLCIFQNDALVVIEN